jgi:hypothetical protein
MFPKPNGTGIPGAVGLCHHLAFHTKEIALHPGIIPAVQGDL